MISMMKAWLLIFGVLVASAMAEEKLVEGGRSPDGEFEVRIARANKDPSDYDVIIHRNDADRRIFVVPDMGGYLQFNSAVERDRARWHGRSRCVAITDQGTRHSRELYIAYIDEGGKVSMLEPPDFYQNALGRVGAVAMDFTCVVTPQKWEGDDLVLELHFTANGRHTYWFAIILDLRHGPMTAPKLGLKSVKKLREGSG